MTGQPKRFVKRLTDKQRRQLHQVWKEHESHRPRCRAHAILLSARGWTIADLCDAFQVSRPTVCSWLDRWESEGTKGLEDEPRSGAPPKLDEAEQKQLVDELRENPQNPQQAIERIGQETGKRVSRRTLRRIAQRFRLRWKRPRRSTKDRRDDTKFAQAQAELGEFAEMEQAGEIHLWFFDEAGFTLQPPTPYAWQPIGETISIPSRHEGGVSAMGFLDLNCQLHPYEVEGPVDAQVVIDVFNDFASKIEEPAVVVIDNASVHTAELFQDQLVQWVAQGLFTYALPPYSPELNRIETLWREIKHHWLPFEAYQSVSALWNHLGQVLAGVGDKFTIDFATPAPS